ncbi:PepSY domain-containing protein [Hymenobacter sp. DG01]|uniref:PepSY domain-containing protein n=1 Tax=Hymenobacter sp. DG01 TaxID=2584940 RepID=UPI001122768D|nr:PepSY domain-containing protein [Hymenobacter sp. DG01]
MKDRLGEAAYSQVRFLEGRVVDVDSVLKQPNDIKWNVCSYYLCFAFQGATAQVGLDKWGQPVNDLTLPEISRYPERGRLISRSAALQIARRKQVLRKSDRPEDVQAEISYSPELGVLRWIITVRQRKTDFASDIRKIALNAHTGEVLRIRKYESRSDF